MPAPAKSCRSTEGRTEHSDRRPGRLRRGGHDTTCCSFPCWAHGPRHDDKEAGF